MALKVETFANSLAKIKYESEVVAFHPTCWNQEPIWRAARNLLVEQYSGPLLNSTNISDSNGSNYREFMTFRMLNEG